MSFSLPTMASSIHNGNADDDYSIREDASEQVWSAKKLAQASYKDLGSPSVVEDRFYRHLMGDPLCLQSMRNLLAENSTTTRDYSVTIDAFDLIDNDPILGQMLLRFPATLLPLLENAIVRGQKALLQEHPHDMNEIQTISIKGLKQGPSVTRVHARLVNLPPSCCQTTWSAASVGKILQVSGTVVRTRPVQMYECARAYTCSNCKRAFIVHADLEERHNALPAPTSCPHQCKGKCKFQIVPEGSVHTDYQEIKLQESASDEKLPRSLLVKLHHDLVDTCQPGDDVVIVGSLLAQWQSVFPEEECSVGLALSAHSVRVIAETSALQSTDHFREEFETYWRSNHGIRARDFICQAVCPKLYGMKMIKLGLLLTIIGGVSSDVTGQDQKERQATEEDEGPIPFQVVTNQTRDDEPLSSYYDGQRKSRKSRTPQEVQTRRRHQSHLLLVGDPGTGKSQFLRFAAALCPRSVLTTGVGTTSAGLTCAAVRDGDGKEYSLEAGALVLADKGVCCIDEFGCIRDQDRTTIHEAMEQQTLSVAKAGIVCKLNCRATIIAVMNPRDCLYDDHVSLAVNTGLGTPLLSRFDLIFKLIDSSDAARDYNVTTYLLNQSIQNGNFEINEPDADESPCSTKPWNMEKLRAYIAIVKERFQPSISCEAALLLERHYERCRSFNGNTTIPVTVRFLESLIRLSQAHARLMFRPTVLLEDAVAVLEVMECTAFACGGFDGNDDHQDASYCDPMSIDFCENPDSDFLCHHYRTLHRYDMLEYMEESLKLKAQSLLSQTALGVPQSWSDVENPIPTFESHSFEPTVTQDHYGRFHFDRSQSKRPRVDR